MILIINRFNTSNLIKKLVLYKISTLSNLFWFGSVTYDLIKSSF